MQRNIKNSQRIKYYTLLCHTIGDIGVMSNGEGLVFLCWEGEIDSYLKQQYLLSNSIIRNDNAPEFKAFNEQLEAYLEGKLKTFSVHANLAGSHFQKAVWKNLLTVPYGTTLSYAAFASRYFAPSYTRAVATSIARNPLPIIYPCHRVVPKHGGVGQFSGGSELKTRLIALEALSK